MAEVMVRTYAGDTQIGIALLLIFAFYKPVRTLVVTYQRVDGGATAGAPA